MTLVRFLAVARNDTEQVGGVYRDAQSAVIFVVSSEAEASLIGFDPFLARDLIRSLPFAQPSALPSMSRLPQLLHSRLRCAFASLRLD